MTDSNKQREELEEFNAAVEERANEIQETLLSVDNKYEAAFVTDSQGNKCELSDFIADMEIDAGVFAEFMKECFLGQGSYFRNKMLEQLEKHCLELATKDIKGRR